jgi:tetratricopeptide (TPR) repeat protein
LLITVRPGHFSGPRSVRYAGVLGIRHVMLRSPRYVIATVIAALALLIVGTALLASVHARVRVSRTNEHLERGTLLTQRGKLGAAVDEYHAALALERDNRTARRALALTLLSLGRLSEAESYLRDLQREQPTDGVLNRALARIYAARGRVMDARAAYQRAIYGEWPGDPIDPRIATGFELIDYLRRLGAREEMVAELVRLKAELPPGHIASARHVAALLAASGEPSLAIDLLSASALTAPRDVDLLAQLADVQAAAGRTLEARATLERAVALEPTRTSLGDRLAVINRVLALDPTLPRLRLVTRTRRARLLLAAVVEQTRVCHDSPEGESARDWKDAASRARGPAPATAEAADQEIALAARLWAAVPACHASSPEARAIQQVLQQIEAAAEPPS